MLWRTRMFACRSASPRTSAKPQRSGSDFGTTASRLLVIGVLLAAGCGDKTNEVSKTPDTAAQQSPTGQAGTVAQDTPPSPKERAPMPPLTAGEKPPSNGDKPEKTDPVQPGSTPPGVATSPDEPVEAPAFPSPESMPKVAKDPPVSDRQPRKPMAAPPEAEGLVRVTPNHDIWLDGKNKRVVLGAKVVLRQGPLELFATLAEQKEHEAVVSVLTEAYFVHAALINWGFEPGHTVRFRPEYVPAEGPEVEITVHWTDEAGKRQSARAQDWVRDAESGKPLEYPWVFGGSGFYRDEETGRMHYLAEGGDLICVSNFPSAMLDLPIRSSDVNNSLLYEAFTDRIPPRGTEVALVLTPKPWKKPATGADDGPVEAPAPDETTSGGKASAPPMAEKPTGTDDGPVAAPPVE